MGVNGKIFRKLLLPVFFQLHPNFMESMAFGEECSKFLFGDQISQIKK